MKQRNPFDAVPIVAESVEAQADAHSLLYLRREIPAKGRIANFMSRKLGLKSYIRANLDDKGTFFWKQIDGKRTLREIAELLRREFSLSEQASRESTIAFTKMLMLRHLIHLDIGERKKP